MPIAIAQMGRALADPEKNKIKMLSFIAEAKKQGAESIIFPELALSGPLYDELAYNDGLIRECAGAAGEIAAAAYGIKIIFGQLVKENDRLFSRIYVAEEGGLKPVVAAGAGPFIANCAGPSVKMGQGELVGLCIDGQIRQTLILQGDWRNKNLPALACDADLLLCLSSWPLVVEAAQNFSFNTGIPAICLNSVGLYASGKTNYLFAGRSAFYGAKGEILAAAPYFEEGLYIWHWHGGMVSALMEKNRLLTEALIEGVRLFCAAIRINRAVIGISGGIDSAVAACVYRQALGADKVFLISMPSRFNSQATRSLSEEMAQALGLGFRILPINDSTDQIAHSLEEQPFESVSGKKTYPQISGYVKENIMARERARILAAAAAGLDAIFTCNGNKAELAVGYATFYGDLAGAFAAEADLWKHQVYAAADWFQNIFPDAPLKKIAAIRPSAELSAAQDVTKDLGDPLTYAYHDYLLKSWVEDDQTPTDTLRAYAQGCLATDIGCERGLIDFLFKDTAAFIADVEYWWRMYRGIGVAKRLQAPPLLALSAKPFGEPKPQVQGVVFFDREFAGLKRKLIR